MINLQFGGIQYTAHGAQITLTPLSYIFYAYFMLG